MYPKEMVKPGADGFCLLLVFLGGELIFLIFFFTVPLTVALVHLAIAPPPSPLLARLATKLRS